jgi:hypothetical protein
MFDPLIARSEKSGAGVVGAIAEEAEPATKTNATLATIRKEKTRQAIDRMFMTQRDQK